MDTFTAHKSGLLVNNMSHEAAEMEEFPVLFGDEVAHFHRIDGGYNEDEDVDIVNFVHEVQSINSPYRVNPDQAPHTVEAHLSENYYNLDVDAITTVDNYPETDYVISLKVSDYQFGEYSFSEVLSADIDKRTREFSYE